MNEEKITEGNGQVRARRRIPRTAWLLLCVVVLAGLAYQGHRNYNGYCSAQGRTLPDSELVRAAVGFSASEIGIENNEAAIGAFVAAHPDCCHVDRSSHLTSGWFARLIGSYWVGVDLAYEVRPELATKAGIRGYRRYVEVDACGARGAMHGEFIDPVK